MDHNLEMTLVNNGLTASWKPTALTIGRPRSRCEGEVRVDLGKIKIQSWTKKATDREAWKRLFSRLKLTKICNVKKRRRRKVNCSCTYCFVVEQLGEFLTHSVCMCLSSPTVRQIMGMCQHSSQQLLWTPHQVLIWYKHSITKKIPNNYKQTINHTVYRHYKKQMFYNQVCILNNTNKSTLLFSQHN